MASLLSWAGKAVKRVANTVNNDVVHPVERAAGAVAAPVVNTAQVPYSAARLAAANVTGNQQAANNARRAVGSDANNNIFSPVKPLGNLVAGSLYARSGALDRNANQAANQAFHVGQLRYGNSPVARAYSGELAGQAKQQIYGNELSQAHLTPTTSKAGLALRTGGAVASAASPLLYVAGGGAGAVSKGIVPTLKVAGKFGAANAAATASGIAAQGAPAKSYVKPVLEAGALGAAAPLVGKAVKVASPVVAKGAAKLSQENPAVAELQAKKQASIKAMDTAKPGMMKNLVANVNSLDSQIKAIKEGGGAKAGDIFPDKAFDKPKPKVVTVKDSAGNNVQMPASQWDAKAGLPKELTKPVTPPKPGTDQYAEMMNEMPPPRGVILKETKPRGGRQDVIVARHNPDTGHLQATRESIQAPPKFLQPEGVGAKPALKPNIELDRSIQHTLKNGTSEDAVQTVMDTTGADLQSAAKYVSRVAKQSGVDLGFQDSTRNPKLGTVSVPTVKQGDLGQPALNAKFVQEHEHRVGQQALDSFGKLTPHDQVLLKQIETGTVSKVAEKANNPAAFKQAEQSIRNYYDTRHAYDRYLGIDVGYRTNYLRQIFNKVEQNSADSQISLKGSNKRPGYTHERTNETLGADVHDALQKDISGASFNHAKLAYEQGINEATGGKVAKGELVRTPQDGNYVQLQNKYGQDLSVPKDTAQQINSRTWEQPSSKALQRYDSVNHMLKYVKLSGGLFHAFTEGGNFVGQQIVSGKLVTNPTATGKMFKIFFSPKAMTGEMNRLAQSGKLDQMHLAGLQLRPKDIKADINVSALENGTSKVAKYTGVQSMHNATFQREIPYAKAKIFEQKTQGLDVNNPADLAKMREVARGINNLFGGINREVNGIKPNTFQWLQRGLLATDFTEGKLHTLWDAATHGGPAGKLAREAVVGKALLFAVLATAGAAAGGEFKGQNGKQIAKNAAGNLADPSFEMGGYKVGFPKTHISELVGAVKPTTHTNGAPWNASGLLTYAQDRAAALPSEAIQLLSNKNYYGQPLYGKNTKKNGGGPISAPQTALNVGQTVLPIPFGQATNTITGKQNAAAAAANIVGFKAKPNPANSVTLQGVNTTLTDPQRREYTTALSNTKKNISSQLTSSPAYSALTPNQQAQAMTNLNGYITTTVNKQIASKYGLGQFSQGFTGKQTQASAKEQQIASGKINPTDFFPGNASSATTAKKAKTAKTPKVKATKVAKAKSTRTRTKGTRTSKAKTVSLASYLSTVKSGTGTKIKTPSAPSFKVASSTVPKFKSVSLKQYRLQKSKIA